MTRHHKVIRNTNAKSGTGKDTLPRSLPSPTVSEPEVSSRFPQPLRGCLKSTSKYGTVTHKSSTAVENTNTNTNAELTNSPNLALSLWESSDEEPRGSKRKIVEDSSSDDDDIGDYHDVSLIPNKPQQQLLVLDWKTPLNETKNAKRGRGRGRPKGSKRKNKETASASSSSSSLDTRSSSITIRPLESLREPSPDITAGIQTPRARGRPKGSKTKAKASKTSPDIADGMQIAPRGRGRPKGSKSKPKTSTKSVSETTLGVKKSITETQMLTPIRPVLDPMVPIKKSRGRPRKSKRSKVHHGLTKQSSSKYSKLLEKQKNQIVVDNGVYKAFFGETLKPQKKNKQNMKKNKPKQPNKKKQNKKKNKLDKKSRSRVESASSTPPANNNDASSLPTAGPSKAHTSLVDQEGEIENGPPWEIIQYGPDKSSLEFVYVQPRKCTTLSLKNLPPPRRALSVPRDTEGSSNNDYRAETPNPLNTPAAEPPNPLNVPAAQPPNPDGRDLRDWYFRSNGHLKALRILALQEVPESDLQPHIEEIGMLLHTAYNKTTAIPPFAAKP